MTLADGSPAGSGAGRAGCRRAGRSFGGARSEWNILPATESMIDCGVGDLGLVSAKRAA